MGKKKVVGNDGKQYIVKEKKPFYKKIWFWIVVILLIGGVGSGLTEEDTAKDTEPDIDQLGEPDKDDATLLDEPTDEPKTETSTPERTSPAQTEDNSLPTEHRSALKKAESYAKTMKMSKQGVYDQLTSEYGEQFSAEAAQYAIENLSIDWNKNALASAESYAKTMKMSKAGIYEQLISEHGEQFTPEEAQYAIENVAADWNKNALETAKNYQDTMSMSPEAIRDQLTSDYGEKFTPEEAEYAIQNLNN
ncbi:hypothetical protein NRIC_08730 [Enterococcus florum]|uniref:Putative host cell surface-exposed lipoprotein Ltp-like HTH region domain-containing protein n=1 Tax=Enterococcus florum TaxID=2480627 RepID=A0A4P5PC17_9ENTE|nr:Ltp family lipoprotein [Enterococcus florum]GCF92982.1 hypothetical protein NRIC_08730 [Enterococcus florum]